MQKELERIVKDLANKFRAILTERGEYDQNIKIKFDCARHSIWINRYVENAKVLTNLPDNVILLLRDTINELDELWQKYEPTEALMEPYMSSALGINVDIYVEGVFYDDSWTPGDIENRIAEYQSDLDSCIKEERYEEAARIKGFIDSLKKRLD